MAKSVTKQLTNTNSRYPKVEKNILLLANGKGTRFKSDYPKTPKPLIPYKNKPLIRWSFESILDSELAEANKITIVSNNNLTLEYAKNSLMAKTLQINPTNSPAETLLECKCNWQDWEYFYTVDCDVSFRFNSKNVTEKYFMPTTQSSNPAYSYVNAENNNITEISEKNTISKNAVIGVYPFNARLLKKYFDGNLFNSTKCSREIYLSDIINYQIKAGLRIALVRCQDFKPLGVPTDLLTQ